jgi:Family of unknown function (DUF5677)
MANNSLNDEDIFRLADTLVEKPSVWSQSRPKASNTPVLSFVRFRAFDRALTQYRSFVQLLRSGHWEDALVLLRSMYELNLNLSEIDSEEAAKKFVRFGKFQTLRLLGFDLNDRLLAERAKPQPSRQVIDRYLKERDAISSRLDREFGGEFRKLVTRNAKCKPKQKKQWQDSWSGVSVEELAKRSAKKTGASGGQSDYYVFRLGSLFTHNTPGSLLLVLPPDRETADWLQFRRKLDASGRNGVRKFLSEALTLLIDVIGMAGDSIDGYERQWFDDTALPVLKKVLSAV